VALDVPSKVLAKIANAVRKVVFLIAVVMKIVEVVLVLISACE
jgi:hypothetical protein